MRLRPELQLLTLPRRLKPHARQLGAALAAGLLLLAPAAVGAASGPGMRVHGPRVDPALAEFERLAATPPTVLWARNARRLRSSLEHGERIGRLRIPRIGLDVPLFEGAQSLGTDGKDDALSKGPAHMSWTRLPGEGGTFAVAGHRTTWTKPFWALNELRGGDRIIVVLPYGTATYTVTRQRIVAPTDVEVTWDRGRERIVLSACHPRFSAAQRLIVEGVFADRRPSRSARRAAERDRRHLLRAGR